MSETIVFRPAPSARAHHDPDSERVGPDRYAFRGAHPYPGLVMRGRYSAALRDECSACGAIVRPSGRARHVAARHPGASFTFTPADRR